MFADSCWRVSGLFYPKVQKFLVMFLLKVAILGYKNHIILTHGKWWMENDQPKCRVSSGGFKYTGRSSLACLEMLQHNLGRWKLVNVFADGPKCDDKHLQRFIPLMFNYLSWRENTLVIKNYCQILISVEQKNDPCIAGKALPLQGFLRINQWM